MLKKLHIFRIFPALQIRNYQLYFFGQLISLIGTWFQIVAQSWLVLQLTNSAFMVGLVAAIGALPILLFALFGGVIVDHFPKKTIIIITQAASMILAFILGTLTLLKIISIPEIIFLAFCLGVVNAIDYPARQAFVIEMVGKEVLASAVALNSGVFNAARVIGPSIAGLIIAFVGTGSAFILNGISFIAVIIALIFIQTKPTFSKKNLHPIKAIKQSVAYAYAHPVIRSLLIFVAVVSIFGWSYMTILPFVAKNIFYLDAAGLGYLYSAIGLGALMATTLVSALSKNISPMIFIFGGNIIFAISLILFTFITYIPIVLLLLMFTGLGLIAQFSMINTTLQHTVSDEMRGRVMSLYVLMFSGLAPIGNFQIGLLAEKFGSEIAIRIGAIIVFIYGIYLMMQKNKIKERN